MLSKSANPSLATPSQAPRGEGVETGWEPPDRVTAKVKAQSRPRTLSGRAAAKAEVAWDQESPGSSPGGATQSPTAPRASSGFALTRRFAVGGAPQLEPRAPTWAIELHHGTQRLLVGLLVS